MQEGNDVFGQGMTPPMDPGQIVPPPPSKAWERLVTLVALALLVTVTVIQRPEAPDMQEVREARSGKVVDPVSINPLVGFGKALLWFKGELHKQPAGAGAPPVDAADYLRMMNDFAHSAADKFRLAILAGELKDSAEREKRLTELETQLDPDSPLIQDIKTVRALTSAGPEAVSPSPEAKADLRTRHGWFSELLLAGETPGGEALFEQQVAHDGAWLVVVLVLFGLWLFAAIVAGLVLLIIFLIKWTNGTLPARFVRTPAEQGSDRGVWLETFAVFLGAFLLVHFVGGAIAGLAPKKAMWPLAVVLLMQWCLVGVIFWPRLRGMSWERFCGEIGWHRGRGVLREISAGVMGYLAGLPLYFLMALVVTLGTMLIEMIKHMAAGGKGTPEDMPLPDNKVFDMLEGSSGWMLFLLGTLIVVWAPLVEESIFRGALYRHLRQRLGGSLGMVISVGLVAAAFAAAHAYVLAGVIMVATLGAIFSVMREQRGSLIAPMTAHCMHNSMVMALVLAILPVMRG